MSLIISISPNIQRLSRPPVAQSHSIGRQGLDSSGVRVPLGFQTGEALVVILALIVGPGIAAIISLAWLSALVWSFLALLMRWVLR